MTRDISAELRARPKSVKRSKDAIETAAVLVIGMMGKEKGVAHLERIDASFKVGEAKFHGPQGEEQIRCDVATQVATGYATGPGFGAGFAIRAVTGDGTRVAVVLDFDGAAAIAAAAFAHCKELDDLSLTTAASHRAEFRALVDEIATDHIDLSEHRLKAHKEAQQAADLTIRAHALAATEKATEIAERKAYDAVRRLATAAQMAPGAEKSMLLEEAMPMIRRAYEG